MGIFATGRSKYAYTDELTCPFADCGSNAVRFVEEINLVRLRYRCRKCGKTFQYDISNRTDLLNPYAG
jgi:transposase-like protein